jgi:hypothetical protein
MINRPANNEKDQNYDPKGERGGDTGKTDQMGEGVSAEKGDQRRNNPVHSGPTRTGEQGTTARRRTRSGSESDARH